MKHEEIVKIIHLMISVKVDELNKYRGSPDYIHLYRLEIEIGTLQNLLLQIGEPLYAG